MTELIGRPDEMGISNGDIVKVKNEGNKVVIEPYSK
jgi:hypothetical protein